MSDPASGYAPGVATAAPPSGGRALSYRFTEQPLEGSEGLLTAISVASRNPFLTPEWLKAWWAHFAGRRRQARLVRCDGADGALVTVLPLYLWRRRPVRVLRFLGHGPSDLLAPPAAPGAAPAEVATALASYLAGSAPQWDVFLGEQIPAQPSLAAKLRGTVVRREGSPALAVRGTWEGYLGSLSANMRQQIRRRERNLGRNHDVRFRLAETPEALDRDLDVLFALHRRQWGSASRKLQSRRGFHDEFARLALDRDWLRLWTLELDGRPVAVWYGIRFAGVDTYYQSARDPRYERESVGLVLLAHTIREAHRDHVSEYRFGRGGETYKYRLATHDHGLETFMVCRTARGRLGLHAASAMRRLPRGPLATVRRFLGD
jgi:CelD/BcsL family acetyltransferase involved in cellulose biosynthesis